MTRTHVSTRHISCPEYTMAAYILPEHTGDHQITIQYISGFLSSSQHPVSQWNLILRDRERASSRLNCEDSLETWYRFDRGRISVLGEILLETTLMIDIKYQSVKREQLFVLLLSTRETFVHTHKAVPWLKRLVADISPRRAELAPGPVHVGFVVHSVALRQVFLRVLRFTLSISSRHGSSHSYITWGMNSRSVNTRSSAT
jgi:hypothetical protein